MGVVDIEMEKKEDIFEGKTFFFFFSKMSMLGA